jgi:hypothetical protein
MPSHIYLTTTVLTLNPQSDTMHLTCNSKFTVMPLTSLSPSLSHELEITSNLVTKQTHPPNQPLTNDPLLCHATALRHMVSSVAEAESGAVFVNAKEGTVTHTTFSEMSHKQDATDLRTNNSTADGIISNTVQQSAQKQWA